MEEARGLNNSRGGGGGGGGREARWEAKRQARLAQSANPPAAQPSPQSMMPQEQMPRRHTPDQASFPPMRQAPDPSSFAPMRQNPDPSSFVPPRSPVPPDSYVPARSPAPPGPRAITPGQRPSQYRPPSGEGFYGHQPPPAYQAPPPMMDDPRSSVPVMMPNSYVPEERPRSNIRTSIPMIDPKAERQKQYLGELQQQMQEREQRQKSAYEQPEPEEYFPFGKPGAGAPVRDSTGQIIAKRPPNFQQNDQRASQYQAVRASQPQMQSEPLLRQPMPGSYAPSQPQLPPELQYKPFSMLQDNYGPPPMQLNQGMPPSQMAQQDYVSFEDDPYPGQLDPTQQPPVASAMQFDQPAAPGGNSKKSDYQRMLLEQIEQKKKKQEEEKRQRILEEQIEEQRLEKERREMEEEYRRENDKKKKQVADLDAFNGQNYMAGPKQPPQRRQPTPPQVQVQTPQVPPRQPPDFQQPPPEPIAQRGPAEIPIEITQQMQANLDNEVMKLRNEINQEQNQLRDNVARLKEEAQQANQQRYAAQQELERIKEEMQQRKQEEDIRQRELYNALINQQAQPAYAQPPVYEQPASIAQPTSYAQPEPQRMQWQQPAANLDAPQRLNYGQQLDPEKSLVSNSRFVPLANTSPQSSPEKSPDQTQFKPQFIMDAAIPSLPAGNEGSLSLGAVDPGISLSSNTGISNINAKNDARLRRLEKFENTPNDEVSKLDDLLFDYLNENAEQQGHPQSTGGARKNMASIPEEGNFGFDNKF